MHAMSHQHKREETQKNRDKQNSACRQQAIKEQLIDQESSKGQFCVMVHKNVDQQNQSKDQNNGPIRVSSNERLKRKITASPKMSTKASKPKKKKQLSVKNNILIEGTASSTQITSMQSPFNTPKPTQTNKKQFQERYEVRRQSSQNNQQITKNGRQHNSSVPKQLLQATGPSLEMSIKMGQDGKVYASIGGVLQPTQTQHQDNDPSSQRKLQQDERFISSYPNSAQKKSEVQVNSGRAKQQKTQQKKLEKKSGRHSSDVYTIKQSNISSNRSDQQKNLTFNNSKQAVNQESFRMSSANNTQNIKADDQKEKRAKSVKKATVDQNYVTSMRNKVKEDSKKLKQEVAQQIIGSNSIRTSTVNELKLSQDPCRSSTVSPQSIIHQTMNLPNGQSVTLYADKTNAANRHVNPMAMTLLYNQITSDSFDVSRNQVYKHAGTEKQSKQQIQIQGKKMNKRQNSTERINANKGERMRSEPSVLRRKVQNNDPSCRNSGQFQRSEAPESINYTILREKRGSQPPLYGKQNEVKDSLTLLQEKQNQLFMQQAETLRRNNSTHYMPQNFQHQNMNLQQNFIIPYETTKEKKIPQNKFLSTYIIDKNEFTVEGQSVNLCETPDEFQSFQQQDRILQQAIQNAHLSDQQAQSIIQGETFMRNGMGKVKESLQFSSPKTIVPNSYRTQNQGSSAQKRFEMLDCNAKKARILLEKKKKQFEQIKDSKFHSTQQATIQELESKHNRFEESDAFEKQHKLNSFGQADNFICTPNISYKSIQPGQYNQTSPKARNFAENNHQQQLITGQAKKIIVGNQIQREARKAHQDHFFSQNKGIQGKNMTIMHQSKTAAYQASLINQIKQASNFDSGDGEINNDTELIEALEGSLDPAEFQTFQMIQKQLQKGVGPHLEHEGSRMSLLKAINSEESNQFESPFKQTQLQMQIDPSQKKKKGKETSFYQFGNRNIFFNLKGQTFENNTEQSKHLYLTGKQKQLTTSPNNNQQGNNKLIAISIADMVLQQQQTDKNINEATSFIANQMVGMNFNANSLTKMFQDAQFEATIQAFTKNREQKQNNELNQNLTSQYDNQRCQQHTVKVHVHDNSEKLQNTKYITSHKAQTVKQGESNLSLSTKPATSTTLNSTHRKRIDSAEDVKLSSPGKRRGKQANKKQKIHIYHDWNDDQIRNHKINKAINTINNIIRLVFKNTKNSTAITSTNNIDMLNIPPSNRNFEDYRKIEELQRIAKQINISIPRKFDSKTALREFFYSRDFILTVKIKMQNMLHKAILSSNNLPQSVIEANMCGNSMASGAPSKEENKIYQAKKFWVGYGNNFPIVKSVLKQRYWWQYGSEESFAVDCDFIWTSWKKQKHIDYLTNMNNKTIIKAQQQMQEQANISPLSRQKSESRISKKKKEKTEQFDPQISKIVFPLRLYNKLEQNKQLTNKKGLFINMRNYYDSIGQDPFKVLPLTFHTTQGINDPEFRKFNNLFNQLEQRRRQAEVAVQDAIKQYHQEKKEAARRKRDNDVSEEESESEDEEEVYEKIKRKHRVAENTWIIKPGENTNRGQGITVVKTVREVQQIIGRPMKSDEDRTFIIQKYIDYPLLVHRRKFDFRCFGVLTSINGSLKGYCYQDGYIRTSCREYSLDDVTDQFTHLTNDAIQQQSDEYGKFESGNKLSLQDFTKIISAQQPELDFDFHRDIFPQMQKLIADTFKASFTKIDPQRLQNSFELFGYDFMLDDNFRLYLIEVNTNPCLEVCCPLLARIIPEVLDNTFKIVLDPLFPSPDLSHNRKFQLNELPQEVKFQLVFDEDVQGEQIRANQTRGVRGSIREVGEEDIESDKENELAEDDADAY